MMVITKRGRSSCISWLQYYSFFLNKLTIFSALVIVVPLILPIAAAYGIHPVHLGIIFLANIQIGYLTPPVGMNLFIASYRFKKSISEIYNSTLPFMLILLIVLLFITYIPSLSLAFI